MKKKAIVCHSGGMDSSICLSLAIRDFGAKNVLSLAFQYHQRHQNELTQAAKICHTWGVDHAVLNLSALQTITNNALTNSNLTIEHTKGYPPNTLVVGRNGLMARLAAIYAHELGAHFLYMGVIEVEGANSGYRDCSRHYMDLKQDLLRLDLDDPIFEIRTPLVKMTKKETLELANELGILDFLLKETITCYEGVPLQGCMQCPSCFLRNEGIRQYMQSHPHSILPFQIP